MPMTNNSGKTPEEQLDLLSERWDRLLGYLNTAEVTHRNEEYNEWLLHKNMLKVGFRAFKNWKVIITPMLGVGAENSGNCHHSSDHLYKRFEKSKSQGLILLHIIINETDSGSVPAVRFCLKQSPLYLLNQIINPLIYSFQMFRNHLSGCLMFRIQFHKVPHAYPSFRYIRVK